MTTESMPTNATPLLEGNDLLLSKVEQLLKILEEFAFKGERLDLKADLAGEPLGIYGLFGQFPVSKEAIEIFSQGHSRINLKSWRQKVDRFPAHDVVLFWRDDVEKPTWFRKLEPC